VILEASQTYKPQRLLEENVPEYEGSSKVAREFHNILACCTELYREKMSHAAWVSSKSSKI
jgi:hypothetical protein